MSNPHRYPVGRGRFPVGLPNWRFLEVLLLLLSFAATDVVIAQSNPPALFYYRSYTPDLPSQPLVSLSVGGASNVACLVIEEQVPSLANPTAITGGGTWNAQQGIIRWGPYFNTVSTNVGYRLAGLPGNYPIDGRAWADGAWNIYSGTDVVPIAGATSFQPSQVATPTFSPLSGTTIPNNITLACATPGATIYYTLDGTIPTVQSSVYTVPIHLANASTVRAVGMTNGWLASVIAEAAYGPSSFPANVTFARSISTNAVVSFVLTPGTNAACFSLTESLPAGVIPTSITGGGIYVSTNSVILWGPFFGTNVQTFSYQVSASPGSYPLQASWTADGVRAGEADPVTCTVNSPFPGGVPTPPPQVASPVFSPASGGTIPTSIAITCTTPAARIYYTLDGTVPTSASPLYSGPLSLVAATTIRAVALTNGWLPSAVIDAAYAAPAVAANAQLSRTVDLSVPAAPKVVFNLTLGSGAKCWTLTETIPEGLMPTAISGGGQYLTTNQTVVWGPFFGVGSQSLSYVAQGPAGSYPVQAKWTVDGVVGTDSGATTIVILSSTGIGAPPQEPTPLLSPSSGSGLPVTVSIASGDPQGQIYYTTDGTVPTALSAHYTAPLTITTSTVVRTVAIRAGYLASVTAVGNYVAAAPTTMLSLALYRVMQRCCRSFPWRQLQRHRSAAIP